MSGGGGGGGGRDYPGSAWRLATLNDVNPPTGRPLEPRREGNVAALPLRVCVRVFVLHSAATTTPEDGKQEHPHKYTPSLVCTSVCVRGGCALAVAVLWKCTKTIHKNYFMIYIY